MTTILSVLWWLSSQIDARAQGAARSINTVFLTSELDEVHLAIEDYSYWSLAYEIVQSGDRDAVWEHLGSGATESELFDDVMIVSPDGDLIFGYSGTNEVAAFPATSMAAIAPMLDALRQNLPEAYVSIAGFSPWEDEHAIVAVAWVTPDYVTDLAHRDLPIMVATRRLNRELMTSYSSMSGLSGHIVSQVFDPQSPSAVPLEGFDGRILGALNWDTPRDGSELRRDVLPGLLLMCAALLGICITAARYFQTQGKRLSKATKVATTDQLTGLLNRAGLQDILARPEVSSAIDLGEVAVIYLDLNEFKQLNDAHGHKSGDIALKVTAQRLQGAVRKGDYVSRLGGDEFVCLIIDADPEAAAQSIASRLVALTDAPISFEAHSQIIRPSIGIAVAQHGIQWETLLEQSDAAMYWAKKQRTTEPVYYCRSMDGAPA
ncbi:diguanylate cyclase domain-containing protein [Roseobacteraceae bacterium S113]